MSCLIFCRFVNHRCVDASLEVELSQRRIVFKAKRCIKAGEELTVDYSVSTPVSQLKKRLRCFCGSAHCRGYIF